MPAPRFALATIAALTFSAAASADEARGVVTRVDPDKKEFRVEGRGPARGAPLTLKYDANTEILLGRDAGTADDLAAGRRVRVVYEDRDGKPVARVVRVVGGRIARAVGRAADRAAPEEAPAPTPAADDTSVTGTLQRVARTDREVVVIGPGAKGAETETTVAVPEKAKIVKGGKPAGLEDLKEGDPVAVRVEKRDGKLQALEVQAGPGAAVGAATAKLAAKRERLIPKIRQALQTADGVLRMIEAVNGDEPPPPPPPSKDKDKGKDKP
jgi:cold shock CspA family protein